MRIKSCSLVLALSLTTGLANAQVVIYDNGGPDLVNAFHSDYDLSGPSDTVQVGDDFTVGAAATFNFIRFYGVYAFDNVPAVADDFVVRVFAHPPTNQPPVNEYAVGNNVTRVDTGIDLFSFDVYEYTVAIPDTNVAAGTHFLSIVNNTPTAVSDWFWCTSANAPDSWERDTDAQPWLADNNSYAFTLIQVSSILYDNGGPDLVNAYHSDYDLSGPSDTVQVGDDFIIAAAGTFSHIKFYGVYAFDNVPAAADDFVIRVFNHPPSNPPVNEYAVGNNVTRVATGQSIANFDVYEYDVSIPATNVAAGQHFLSIVNNTPGTNSDWFWCTSAHQPEDSWERDTDAQPWIPDNNSYAFALSHPSSGLGSNYCGPAVQNSTSLSATISAAGSDVATDNDVTLMAADMPPNQFGYFLNSQTQAFVFPVPGSQGALCLGGQIGRYNASVFNTGAGGTGSLVLNLPTTPTPTGTTAIVAGQTWNWTTWFRDNNPGPTSNFSDALSILFQ